MGNKFESQIKYAAIMPSNGFNMLFAAAAAWAEGVATVPIDKGGPNFHLRVFATSSHYHIYDPESTIISSG